MHSSHGIGKTFFLGLITISTLFSCKKVEPIYYSYNGVTVTRFDTDAAESLFYYGRFTSSDNLPDDYIKATYSGFDGIMNGYLTFENDKKVRFVRICDHFEQVGNPYSKLYLYDFSENIKSIKWHDSIQQNFDNNAFISDVLKIEQSKNRNNHSLVETQYPTAE